MFCLCFEVVSTLVVLRHVCVTAIVLVSESCLKCLEIISVELALLVSCIDFFMRLQSGAHLKILSFEAVCWQSLIRDFVSCFQVVMSAVLKNIWMSDSGSDPSFSCLDRIC